MEDKTVKISWVVPAYNEEEAIEPVLKEILDLMGTLEYTYEVIVVDDGSRDRTAEIASSLPGVRIVTHQRNRGNGAARTTGVKASLGEYVIMTDADGTYPLDAVPEMFRLMDDGAAMVVGARVREAGTMPLLRRPAKAFIKALASYMVEFKIPDLNSGLRVLRKDLAQRFFGILPTTHSWVSTITMAAISSGERVEFVPIDYHPRIGRSTFHPIRDTYNYLYLVVRTIMYFNPVRLFIPLFVALFSVGVIKFIVDLFRFKFTGHIPASTVIILLGAIQVAAIGLLADLIVKTGRLRQ
ncbi:MAG: glycosyltransferase family 2 protein [Anaerolineae bacterium]|jgi:glycosyltransferase involved in cell wall biosynthesis|nr:glycosyltransferase family 2 protein [Chloroflexota bacterium]